MQYYETLSNFSMSIAKKHENNHFW